MTGSADDREPISARVPESLRDELDAWVEESEYGNRGAAIEGIIRDHLGDADASATDDAEGFETFTPDSAKLAAVYSAIIDAVDDEHELHEDELSSIATAVNNDTSTPLTPDADAIGRYLAQLERENFASRKRSAEQFHGDGLRVWRIKPKNAAPDEWKYRPEKIEEYEERWRRLHSPLRSRRQTAAAVEPTAGMAVTDGGQQR